MNQSVPNVFRPAVELFVRQRVSPQEWSARVELAALYRVVAHFRWTDTIYNHISLRVPGEDAFLINPFGALYEEITASTLVKIDENGNVLDDPTGVGINRAGFIIHGAIHSARQDAHCVLHTHTCAGIAVSTQKDGLLPISQHSAILMGRIAYHDFEGIATREDEQSRLLANLGDKRVMILRNHGLLVAARSVAEAFFLMNTLEQACQIQVAAFAAGPSVCQITAESIAETQQLIERSNNNFSRDWAAMVRLADRIAPDFRN